MARPLRYALFCLLAGSVCAQSTPPSHRKPGMAPIPQNPQQTPQQTGARSTTSQSAPAQLRTTVTPPQSTPPQQMGAVTPAPQQAQTQQTQPQSAPAGMLHLTTPEKVPAAAPRISFQNNELTVVAQNSSLGEILNGIRAATGMKIEGPSGSADRVTAKIGPAPVRDVLLSLLEGSRYDFAILGSATDPTVVERLVLSSRTSGGENYAAAPQQPQPTDPADTAPSDDDDTPGIAQPSVPAPPVKTPEQLLEDLRKLEADRAQQQQRNNVTPGDPNAPRTSRPERPK